MIFYPDTPHQDKVDSNENSRAAEKTKKPPMISTERCSDYYETTKKKNAVQGKISSHV